MDEPKGQSPFCADLRSKKYYFLQSPPTTPQDVTDASEHFWCRRTQQAVGPDHEPVHQLDCKGSRACFKPWIGRPST